MRLKEVQDFAIKEAKSEQTFKKDTVVKIMQPLLIVIIIYVLDVNYKPSIILNTLI